MFRFFWLLPIFLSFPIGAHCDHIVLKNGDTLSGDIVAWQNGSFENKTALLGNVKAPWNAVAFIQADHPLYVILANRSLPCNVIAVEDDGIRLTGLDCSSQFIRQARHSCHPLGAVAAARRKNGTRHSASTLE